MVAERHRYLEALASSDDEREIVGYQAVARWIGSLIDNSLRSELEATRDARITGDAPKPTEDYMELDSEMVAAAKATEHETALDTSP